VGNVEALGSKIAYPWKAGSFGMCVKSIGVERNRVDDARAEQLDLGHRTG
jgi:hypothetical protein